MERVGDFGDFGLGGDGRQIGEKEVKGGRGASGRGEARGRWREECSQPVHSPIPAWKGTHRVGTRRGGEGGAIEEGAFGVGEGRQGGGGQGR